MKLFAHFYVKPVYMEQEALNLIRREYESRKALNRAYSMRAFARDLGMSNSLLSMVLHQKRAIGMGLAKKLIDGMHLDAETTKIFLQSVLESSQRTQRAKTAKKPIVSVTMMIDAQDLNEIKNRVDQFNQDLLRDFANRSETKSSDEVYRLNLQLLPLTQRVG